MPCPDFPCGQSHRLFEGRGAPKCAPHVSGLTVRLLPVGWHPAGMLGLPPGGLHRGRLAGMLCRGPARMLGPPRWGRHRWSLAGMFRCPLAGVLSGPFPRMFRGTFSGVFSGRSPRMFGRASGVIAARVGWCAVAWVGPPAAIASLSAAILCQTDAGRTQSRSAKQAGEQQFSEFLHLHPPVFMGVSE